MPELAEVELARRQWTPALGEVVATIKTHPTKGIYRDCPAAAFQVLSGYQLIECRAHGKRLLFSFEKENPLHLEIHLGMSGRLYRSDESHRPEKHDHLVIYTKKSSLCFNDYRTFGRALIHEHDAFWQSLPPQPHDQKFTRAHLQKILARHPKKPLKALLLDQAAFPGVGNWMADEICWKLGVPPDIASGKVSAIPLRKVSRFVTLGALRHVADKNDKSSNEGFSPGSYVQHVPPKSWLFQHRWKKGGHCPKCRSLLARDTIATRTTAWCPKCQT